VIGEGSEVEGGLGWTSDAGLGTAERGRSYSRAKGLGREGLRREGLMKESLKWEGTEGKGTKRRGG
jgi:hypothetical protein